MTPWALARFLMLGAIWGSSFLFMRVALDGISDRQVVVGRMALGAVTLLAILAARREKLPRSVRIWGHLAFLVVFANLIPFFSFAWAEDGRVTSGLAGIFNAMTPLMTMLIATSVLAEERLTRYRTTGLLLAFVGVVLILQPWKGFAGSSLTGQLACLVAATSYGIAITYTRKFLSGAGYSPVTLAAGQISLGALVLLIATPFWAATPVHLDVKVTGAIAMLGVLGTGVAYLFNYGLIRDIGATRMSTVTYAMPVVAVILGVIVLSEPVRWFDFVGAAVIVLGIAVSERRIRWRTACRRSPARRRVGAEQRGSSGLPG